MKQAQRIRRFVKEHYGAIARQDRSCCCSGCGCGPDTIARAKATGYSLEELEHVPSTAFMGLGCGNPVALADLKEGETVLDLGSGGGLDVFLAALKVGEGGRVIGVDMAPEMVELAKKNAEFGGFTNVEFRIGEIERLPVEDASVDVLISNCVINLSPDKETVFKEAFRVLKPGGRLLVSDIVTEGKLPDDVRNDMEAWAGCVAGAMDKKEYLDTIWRAGFREVAIVGERRYSDAGDPRLAGRIISAQIRAVK